MFLIFNNYVLAIFVFFNNQSAVTQDRKKKA